MVKRAIKLSKESTDRFAEVNGVKLHYNEAGSGHALMCFHGGGPGANAWDNSKWVFGDLSQHFRTMLVDMPAYGESDKEQKLGTTPLDVHWARCIIGLMDQLSIDKTHLYVSSQTGAMAFRLAIDYPTRIGKLVVQSSGPGGGGRLMYQASPPEGIKALGKFRQNPTKENMENMVRLFYPNDFFSEQAVEDRFRSAMRPGHLEARDEFSASKNSDLSREVRNMRHPVLVVWGYQDYMVPVEGAMRALSVIPNCQVHIWGGTSGHFVASEHPGEFARLVIDFLTHDPDEK
jgi:pimeloyl-ACP methyl ester carboxylesterase